MQCGARESGATVARTLCDDFIKHDLLWTTKDTKFDLVGHKQIYSVSSGAVSSEGCVCAFGLQL